MKVEKKKPRNLFHLHIQTKYRMQIVEDKKKYKRSRDKKVKYDLE